MATTEERVRQLAANLEVDGKPLDHPLDLDLNVAEAGVNSNDLVAFWKMVNEEFGVEIPAEDFAGLATPRSLIEYLDANAA